MYTPAIAATAAATTANTFITTMVGFLPAETYFCLDSGRNLVSPIFFYFLPAEMRETQDGISHINMLEMKGIQDN